MNPKHPLSTITVYRLVASFILAISIYSCANMSRPGGGPRDETPPVFIKSMPVPNALNVSKQKIEIEFDEIIQVDKPSEKVIVSPPQKDMPEIRTSGRKITVTRYYPTRPIPSTFPMPSSTTTSVIRSMDSPTPFRPAPR